MSVKKRCFVYCNDCSNKGHGWKIIEQDHDHKPREKKCFDFNVQKNNLQIQDQDHDNRHNLWENKFKEHEDKHQNLENKYKDWEKKYEIKSDDWKEIKSDDQKETRVHSWKEEEEVVWEDKDDDLEDSDFSVSKDSDWKVAKDNDLEDNSWKENKLKNKCKCHKYKKDKKKCHKKKKCCKPANYACTLISVKNPDTSLIIPEIVVTSNAQLIDSSVDLVRWVDIVPDALGLFNNVTGIYTASEAGDYQVELVINFQTSQPFAVTVDPLSLALSDVPTAQIIDADTREPLLASFFPTTFISIPPLSTEEPSIFGSILGKGQVIIKAIIPLTAGQKIRVRVVSNGLTVPPSFSALRIDPNPPRIIFNPEGADTTLGIYKLRNTPIVTIDCNN